MLVQIVNKKNFTVNPFCNCVIFMSRCRNYTNS